VLGARAPRFGALLRDVNVGSLHVGGGEIVLSLPMLMLGLLLVVAGLGTNSRALKDTIRRPGLLLAGLTANVVYPIAFAGLVSIVLGAWHRGDQVENILVGLAMIGAMPIAGSSTAWTQNAEGNLALSLGLVLASTLLSPWLTPFGLHAVGTVTHGDYAKDLHELARHGSGAFVALAVVVPSLLGIGLRVLVGSKRAVRVMPVLKTLNLVDLLLLNYSNAAVALPQVVHRPDWDFLALSLAITTTMCVGAFLVGWLIPRLRRADRADQTAMMFGMGMSNNGTGLVLASAALADHPLVLLPIILYNLVQQIGAGIVDAQA
jgi:BASS family bile acid:Na+ symporter